MAACARAERRRSIRPVRFVADGGRAAALPDRSLARYRSSRESRLSRYRAWCRWPCVKRGLAAAPDRAARRTHRCTAVASRRGGSSMKWPASMRRSVAFTLLELMIVLAIAAVLAGWGIPSYREHVVRVHRASAVAALYRAAQYLETLDGAPPRTLPDAYSQAPPDGQAVYHVTLRRASAMMRRWRTNSLHARSMAARCATTHAAHSRCVRTGLKATQDRTTRRSTHGSGHAGARVDHAITHGKRASARRRAPVVARQSSFAAVPRSSRDCFQIR